MGSKKIQRFALDADGRLVDVRSHPDRSGQFFCPNCRDRMIPKMGKVKAWHFAHKADMCAYDAYLHSLAEIRVADWFSKSEALILDMESYEACADHESCAFYNSRECARPIRVQHDLKSYYPACEIEQACGDFVADILCPHAKAPLFIEIFVSHECSEEKKSSGNRIIELVIDSEEAIDDIVSSSIIRESEKVRLYGFKRGKTADFRLERPLTKYTLHRSGKSHVSYGDVTCRNHQYRRHSAIYEVTAGEWIDPIMMYLGCKAMAHRDGYLPKDCSICFWLGGSPGERICKLYKRCGNPMWCDENDAPNCRMFRENRQLIEDCLEMCRDWGAYEIWRRDSRAEFFGERKQANPLRN